MSYGIICPHCGFDTGIEPALVEPDAPMIHCPECDEPLFGDVISEVNEIFNLPKCYKTGAICRYECKGLCKDSC